MVKVSSRDILSVLRRYELAGDDNVPRNIENVKTSNPNAINTLVCFRYNKNQFYLLLDDTANDNVDYIIKQIQTKNTNIKGQLFENPTDSEMTYGLPFKGKDAYLYTVISEKKRLDSELAERYPENSRSTWAKHIKAGHVSVNNKIIISTKYNVADIDVISINKPDMPDFNKDELPIVYIDDNVIVINKPKGVLSHAKGALNDEFTVGEFFRRYSTYNTGSNRPGIVHRLDRDTSGIMIGARNEETAIMLQKQFSDRKTKKTYFAILNGVPKINKANIDLPIERNPSAPSTFRVNSNGKSALTKYEVIANDDKYSLVRLEPKTGRTHQLRVHMKYINTPILGDKIYGKPANRLYLHAVSLEITIPNGDRRIFKVPVPTEFTDFFPGVKL
ncbi:MAG: rRNA synthase [Patescibacteria group bacterium]|nr:rRNA synthase [Patescibacteria group bacterium]